MQNKIKAYLLDISCLDDERVYNASLKDIKEYRQEKINRLLSPAAKKLSLGTELLIKKACDDFGIDYASEEIVFGEVKKPYFKNSSYYFNTSHSGTKVLCVISDKEVGCDIEQIKEKDTEVAVRFFAQNEAGYIGDDLDKFFKIWTLKEAYAKCLGKGLTLPLNSFEICVYEDTPYLYGDNRYQFFAKEIEGYKIAYCIHAPVEEREDYETELKITSLS